MYKLEEIQKLQYRALRICFKAARLTPRIELLSRGQLPKLEYRRIAHLRNYMHKRSKTEKYMDKTDIQTRAHQAPLFTILKTDTKAFDKSVLIKGGLEWNNLSADIRLLDTYDKFKTKQKEWLCSKIPN